MGYDIIHLYINISKHESILSNLILLKSILLKLILFAVNPDTTLLYLNINVNQVIDVNDNIKENIKLLNMMFIHTEQMILYKKK